MPARSMDTCTLRLCVDESEQYYIQIISLLCAFVRHPIQVHALEDNPTVLREDVQATLEIIGSRRGNEEFVALERNLSSNATCILRVT